MQELTKDLRWKIDKYSNNHASSSLAWQSFPQYNNLWCAIEHGDFGSRFTLSNLDGKDSNLLENIALSKTFLKDSRLSASFKALMIGFKYMNGTSTQRICRFQVKFSSVQDFEACIAVLRNYIQCTLAPTKPASPSKIPSFAPASSSMTSLLQMPYSSSSQTQSHDASVLSLLEQQQELCGRTSGLHYPQHKDDMENNVIEATSLVKDATQLSSMSEIDFLLLSDDVLASWIDEAIVDPKFLCFVKRVEIIWAARPPNGLK